MDSRLELVLELNWTMDLPSTLGLETESKPDLDKITGVLMVSQMLLTCLINVGIT